MPKATTPTGPRQARRHNPLEEDLLATGPLKTKAPKRKSKSNAEDGEGFVDADKILQLGRELAEEEEQLNAVPEKKYDAFAFDSRAGHVEGDDDANLYDDEEPWADEDDEVVEELEVDADDLETYNKFMREQEDPLLEHGWDGFAKESEQGPPTNLADIILAKIAAHESGMGSRQQAPGPVDEDVELNPKVVEVYTKIGEILSRYKSGKIPKPMKILPTIPNWEMILEITRPELWTANACYEITRIFCSGKPLVAQRFLEMVILDRVRDEIHETKKLGPHLFKALKKGLYKPSAWFKGILFPLVASGTCTLREASIVSAALVRTSVPVLHSAAAIKGLCDIAAQEASAGTEGGGATNIFIKALLDKRYALPYQVIDALCFHFLRFRSVDPASVKETDDLSSAANGKATHTLPVIWHKTFLAFAERYRDEITEDQREALLDLLLTHGHHTIGAQIRRELLAGRGRGVPLEGVGAGFDGDDTMLVD